MHEIIPDADIFKSETFSTHAAYSNEWSAPVLRSSTFLPSIVFQPPPPLGKGS